MTTTTHRPRCTRPGWTTQPSRSVHGLTIARCTDCGAIELRHTTEASRVERPMETAAAEGSHGRATVAPPVSARQVRR